MGLQSFLAFKFLAGKNRSWLFSSLTLMAFAGVILSVTAFVVVQAVMSGFNEDLEKKILGFSAHLTATLEKRSETLPPWINQLTEEKGVTDVQRFVEGEAVLSTRDGEMVGVRVRGPDREYRPQGGTLQIFFEEEESWDSFYAKGEELPGILLGAELAESMGVVPLLTERVELLFPLGEVGPTGEIEPNVRAFRIIGVVSGGEKSVQEEAFVGEGAAVNSKVIDGLKTPEAKKKITQWLEEKGLGKSQIQYKLRDWLFSRQRYWGEPFPIAHMEDGSIVPIPEDQLPVALPSIDQFKPTEDGQPPLARAGAWLAVTLPDGRTGVREANTMPQWAGSCWYYLRYLNPKNGKLPFSKEAENYWMPVDLYVGGVEHAVLHLLYARFWHKVLYDCGLVHTKEPFQKLFNQGMILAYSYRDPRGKYHHPGDIEEKDGKYFLKATGEEVETQIEKMSKSKLNVVNPDEVIDQYGADAMRLYELFMGPLEATKPWQMDGVEGVYRFLGRVWRLVRDEVSGEMNDKLSEDPPASNPELQKILHQTIKKVTGDTEAMRFNTAISQMMILTNEAGKSPKIPKALLKTFLKVLSPYAPHLAEELWHQLGEKELIVKQEWPTWEPALLEEENIPIIIQVNGKKRGKVSVPKEADKAAIESAALETEVVKKFLAGNPPKKVIVVPGRLVNIVV